MKTKNLILTSFAAVAMLAFTVGCRPAANVDTSTSTSTNVSGDSNSTTNSNATAGSETPGGETP